MKSWYDLTKEEKRQMKLEFNEKNGDNVKTIIFNIFKIIFYLASFAMFFVLVIFLIAKINGECNSQQCENNLILYGTLFGISIGIAIIFSILGSKNKKHFDVWLKSKNILK